MPVLVVTAPALDPGAQVAALAALNRAVGAALGLRAEDVYSTCAPAGTAVLGEQVVRAWPVVLIHGSARAPEAMAAAIDGARAAASASWGCPAGEVWVQWMVSS